MFRFFIRAVPLIVLLLCLFSLAIPFLDPGRASPLSVLTVTEAPMRALVGMWLLEAFGLIGIFLLVEGRSRLWWFDALLASWVAWIFRGPLLVVTLVLAAGEPQAPWFQLIVAWWVLYSICGLALGALVRFQAAAEVRAAREAEAAVIEAEAIEAAEARARAADEDRDKPEASPPDEPAEQTGAETRKFETSAKARDPVEER